MCGRRWAGKRQTSIKQIMWSEVRLKSTTCKYVVGGEALKLDWKLEVALRKEYAFIFKSHQRGLSCLDGTGPCQEEDLCGQLCAYVGQVSICWTGNQSKAQSNSTIKLTFPGLTLTGLTLTGNILEAGLDRIRSTTRRTSPSSSRKTIEIDGWMRLIDEWSEASIFFYRRWERHFTGILSS